MLDRYVAAIVAGAMVGWMAASLTIKPPPRPAGPEWPPIEVPLHTPEDPATQYSTQYQIPYDLAEDIHDMALTERIDPRVAYQLVYTESRFNQRAVSHKKAYGLTQLRLPTAKSLQPAVDVQELVEDRRLNLRLGFRYLRRLIDQYNGDTYTALRAYVAGPTRIANDDLIGHTYARGILK